MKDYRDRMTVEEARVFQAELLPCHRVVNKVGRTAPGWSEHRRMLEAEGVTFKINGHVDMGRFLWRPEIV